MLLQVDMRLVVIRCHRSLCARAVHPFPWASGPGMVGCGHPTVDPMRMTDTIKDMGKGVDVAFTFRALNAMLGEPRVDLLGHRRPHVPEELRGHHGVGVGVQLGIGNLTGAGDRDTEGALACFRADLGHVDGAGADRRGLKPLLCRRLAGQSRSAAHTMPRQTTMSCRSGQVRSCRVQGIEAVIQW